MSFFDVTERRALHAICETLVAAQAPDDSALAQFRANDVNLVSRLERLYALLLSDEEEAAIKQFLHSLERAMINGLTIGVWQPISAMTHADRERLLHNWATSRFAIRRKAFQGVKKVALFAAYVSPRDGDPHPAWASFNYPGLPPAASAERRLVPYTVTSNQTLYCDVLVVGSGAGGGVIAGELSAADYDVMVVEKGDYYIESDFNGDERQASEAMYEKYGKLTTHDNAMSILAGSLLGGGTSINWNASFHTPEHVLREWANEYGIQAAISASWQASLEAVKQRINVTCDESHLNGNNRVLEQGAQQLGYHVGVIPRNVSNCGDCGFCGYGCAYGAKQSTVKTYLQDAYDRGARILVRATVKRVLHQGGQVVGAVIESRAADGTVHFFTVKAKVVVVCAGAIHTPALLQRSGLQNPHIGEHLHLHPTSLVSSIFEDDILTWQGVPMSRVCKEFSDLDGRGYGVTLETAPAHPGLMSATLPWVSAASHKALVSKSAKLANIIAIVRDNYGGRVTVDIEGNPVLHYHLHDYDKAHLQRGILEAAKIHFAAQAKTIIAPHAALYCYENDGNQSDFVRWLRQVEDAGLEPHAYPLFSAHQMSSARIAGSAAQGVCKPTGETWEVRGLYVADGSSLPTATGVNPMISIMGCAHHIAQEIKATL